MAEFTTDLEKLLKEVGSNSKSGLSEEQMQVNKSKFGENKLSTIKKESLLRRLKKAFSEPMIIMLLFAGVIALSVNIFRDLTGGEADYLECLGIFGAILLSIIITLVMEGRSAKAFEALSEIGSDFLVKVIRNQKTEMIHQHEILVGDLIELSSGDRIPADGRLVYSNGLLTDESALTGESNPVKKSSEFETSDPTLPLAERTNMIYSGNFIVSGTARAVITAIGDATEIGKIASGLGGSNNESTPLQGKLARLGKMITFFGVIAAIVVFASQIISFSMHGGLTVNETMEAFVTSIVLIVAAVPEGLPTIVAVSLSINIIKLSKQNALVRKMIASETIGCINIICSDKTGTLTENKMSVNNYFDIELHDEPSDLSSSWLIHNICLNSTADLDDTNNFIGNPTEGALLNFYEDSVERKRSNKSYKDERQDHDVLQSFPFSSELKHMTTISKVDNKIITYAKGSPESIFQMCAIPQDKLSHIKELISYSQQKSMRVIAFAHKEIETMEDFENDKKHKELESDMIFDGFVSISDPLRSDVYETVTLAKNSGIELKILTGDNILTATSIAEELNILGKNSIVIEGKEIDTLSDEELITMLPKISVIARSTPNIKMRIVNLLKSTGNVVAVTGDGINDAPALKNADVGIAMGISGTEVSKEASDIVLLDDSFSTILTAVEWGRNIYENFKRFISFQLTVNLSSVIVVLVSILIGLKAPFTALQLLWINIIMDGPPALTLGLEPNYDDLMSNPPIRRNENILSKKIIVKIVTTALYISFIFLSQYMFNFLGASNDEKMTVLFTLFTIFQLFNSFNCRELGNVSILTNFWKNKIMLLTVASTFILQILIIQYTGALFGTVPLPLILWVKIIVTASSVVSLSEIIKFVQKHKLHH